jgi:hypothetical protein
MAISLASGVMVSTVLTLVVIPLGCVAETDRATPKYRGRDSGQGADQKDGGQAHDQAQVDHG